ncbi:MAG: SusC/RagA family TonB-linked outer membrane protein, partial [Muribaculaceae bacterium]|nr:SusC/RagA family TonB-linked outer membrane protein [Muribaculaceae bacterium]
MKKLVFLFFTVMLCGVFAYAQNQTVKGTVVSAVDDEPLPGATVMPVGSGTGVATDADGNFTVSVPVSCKQLTISYIGMNSQTVNIVPGNMLIKLTDANNALDEVIVVAYGTAKKSAYTGSASVIKADVLENALVSDATSALSGKVAGVQILSSNGQPGVAPQVRIRGVGSINAGTSPLYVVDGIPYDGDISSINTQDIESMTVLKDAAAAALYGARGANGVILVTTKQGKDGAAKVTLDARWGSNSRAVSNYDVMTSPEMYVENVYRSLYNAAFYNQTMTAAAAHVSANNRVFSKLGYQTFTVPQGETLILPNGRINPNARQGFQRGDYYYQPDDWSKYTLRHGLRQEYNMSISGGTDKFNYYASVAYLNDEGLIQGSHFNRLATRANVDYQVKSWLQIGTNLSYAYTNSGYPGEQDTDASASSGNAFFLCNSIAPYYPIFVRNADGSLKIDPYYGKPVYDYGDGESTPYERNFMSISNPAGDLLYNKEDYLSDVFNGKWFAKLTPIDGLTITGTLGYYVDNLRMHYLTNPFYGQSATANGSAAQSYQRTRSINVQGLATYQKTFNLVHAIDVMVGYESYALNIETGTAQGDNLFVPNSWVVSNT